MQHGDSTQGFSRSSRMLTRYSKRCSMISRRQADRCFCDLMMHVKNIKKTWLLVRLLHTSMYTGFGTKKGFLEMVCFYLQLQPRRKQRLHHRSGNSCSSTRRTNFFFASQSSSDFGSRPPKWVNSWLTGRITKQRRDGEIKPSTCEMQQKKYAVLGTDFAPADLEKSLCSLLEEVHIASSTKNVNSLLLVSAKNPRRSIGFEECCKKWVQQAACCA